MTTLYSGNLLDERNERPIEGADLWVYDNLGNEATLTDAADQPVTQPLVTGADGEFEYKAADGIYRHDFWKNSVRIYRDNRIVVGTPATIDVALGAFGEVLVANATAADARSDLGLSGTTGAANVGTADGSTVQVYLNHQKIDETAGNLIYGSTTSGSLLNGTPAGTKDGDISTAFGIGTIPNATTAYALAAFGYNAGNAITTGHSNTMLGYQTGAALTTGIMNTLVGVDALQVSITGNRNTVVGHHCMNVGAYTGEGAVVIGQQTARNFTSGNNLIWIGRNAGANSPATGSQNCVVIGGDSAIAASVDGSVIIGKDAVAITAAISASVIIGQSGQYGGGTIASTVQIGKESMFRATGGGGNNNATLGFQTGYSIEGTGNVLVGYRAGYLGSNATVNSSVCIGNLAGFNMLASGELYIGNSDALSAHLIWGSFASQILKLRSNSLRFIDMPTHADNAAAITAGLVAETVYKTATGELRIVV